MLKLQHPQQEGSFRTWVLHGMNSKPTQMQNKLKKYEINTAWRRRIQVCACQVWNLNTKVWTYAKKIKWRRNNTSTKIFTGKFHFLSFFLGDPMQSYFFSTICKNKYERSIYVHICFSRFSKIYWYALFYAFKIGIMSTQNLSRIFVPQPFPLR